MKKIITAILIAAGIMTNSSYALVSGPKKAGSYWMRAYWGRCKSWNNRTDWCLPKVIHNWVRFVFLAKFLASISAFLTRYQGFLCFEIGFVFVKQLPAASFRLPAKNMDSPCAGMTQAKPNRLGSFGFGLAFFAYFVIIFAHFLALNWV